MIDIRNSCGLVFSLRPRKPHAMNENQSSAQIRPKKHQCTEQYLCDENSALQCILFCGIAYGSEASSLSRCSASSPIPYPEIAQHCGSANESVKTSLHKLWSWHLTFCIIESLQSSDSDRVHNTRGDGWHCSDQAQDLHIAGCFADLGSNGVSAYSMNP